MTIFDIINALGLIREDIIEVPLDMVYSKAYEELKIEGPQEKYDKFLQALHSADYFRASVVGDHKYVNADGTPTEHPIPYYQVTGQAFSITLSKQDIKWENETKFDAYVVRGDVRLRVRGTVSLLSMGPTLEVVIEEKYENNDPVVGSPYSSKGSVDLTIRNLPFDKDRVKYFIGPGTEVPPWDEIKTFVPGSELEKKGYISKMEYHYYSDFRGKIVDQKYQRTEWTNPTYGLYVVFGKH
jgi:hypothetical protein